MTGRGRVSSVRWSAVRLYVNVRLVGEGRSRITEARVVGCRDHSIIILYDLAVSGRVSSVRKTAGRMTVVRVRTCGIGCTRSIDTRRVRTHVRTRALSSGSNVG